MEDIPAALKTLRVPDAHLVAYEVLFVMDPTPPAQLYWAFVRGEPVFEAQGTSDAAAGAAPTSESDAGVTLRVPSRLR